jgi:hypothetical protein
MTNAERRGEGTAVRTKAGPLPALVALMCGAVIITHSVVRVAFRVDGRPHQLLFELGICGAGAALVLWGVVALAAGESGPPWTNLAAVPGV